MEPADFRDAMVRWRLSRLRRLTARPFGLVSSATLPLPVALGSESWRLGIASILRKAVTRSPVPPGSMSLRFGWLLDLGAP